MPQLTAKVLTSGQLLERFGPTQRTGRVVFTNGCFDILHRGHVEYLEYARALGDFLLVGLNSDRSVRALKGAGRPINSEEDRGLVIAALASVDAVTIFDDDTPRELIRALVPDVLVKGGDYSPEQVVGGTEVIRAGGEVIIAPLLPGRSTTGLIQRTKRAETS
ncbi:MAG: D-glycero-beta-D-manno-heptose 1-phosphate adenylyltransferase [Gemmatimonadota bacterium]